MQTLIISIMTICVLAGTALAETENLIQNPGFDQRDDENATYPAHWTQTHHHYGALEFSSDHHSGTAAAMLVGNGKPQMWRQDVLNPKQRGFTLSAMIKSEGAVIGKDEYARLYAHIIYKDQPDSQATHFYLDIPSGGSDWRRLSVGGAALHDWPIEKIQISVLGQFSGGRIYVDDVSLTDNLNLAPEGLLRNKLQDLQNHLERIGTVDASVQAAMDEIELALAALAGGEPDVATARVHWVKAAEAVSHEAWAVMFPEVMSDRPVEVQMMYHGHTSTPEGCDRYLDLIEKAGCNAALLSLGSWMYVNYQSDIFPVEPGYDTFDALAYFIEEAHKRDIKVFAYYAPFYGTYSPVLRPGNMFEAHPEWFAGGPERNLPYFPDPANPEVIEFIVEAYTELVTRYDLDGVGLDYIRYPTERSLGYNEINRKQIQEQYGFDILAEKDLYADAEKWPKVQVYRAEKVGEVVRQVVEAVKSAKPGIWTIASLISEPEMARDGYGQNWMASAHRLDYASPMNYDDRALDVEMLEQQKRIYDGHRTVYIPAVGGMPEVHNGWTISDWAQRVAVQRKIGGDGIIIYRVGDLDPAIAAFFGNGPFHTPARFPEPKK